VVNFTLDNWQLVDIPATLQGGVNVPFVAFLALNEREQSGAQALTPQPGTGIQTLYFSPSQNRAGRIPLLTLPETTGNRVYPSAAGNGVAYFIEGGAGRSPGLYILDVATGVSARVLPITELVQRGMVSRPVWSPDGNQLAIMLATEYATDIYLVPRDGSTPVNATNSGAYDLFPAFSPSGRYLAFVSDRAVCPTWVPEAPNTCDNTGTPPPDGGHLYVLDLETTTVQQLSETWLTEPPVWITDTVIGYAEGNPLFGDSERVLWTADVRTGQAREVRPDNTAAPIMLAEAWSPDGSQVIYQSAGSDADLSLIRRDGSVISNINGLTFPRFGVQAGWSPDGSRVAIGGLNGQCPFGSTVYEPAAERFIARGAPPPSMCAPSYSPDGVYIVFTGVSLNDFDGRSDIYVANPNGFGTVNLTGDLRGTMTLLGWVGGLNGDDG